MKKARCSPILLVAIGINFILFSVKLYIGLRTNSLCIYTDAMNNLADTLSAGIGFWGLFFVAGRATARFPFGFGRLEFLTGLLMALLMTAAGCSFAYNSLERFFAPVPVWFSTKYAGIIAVTCLVKLAMGFLFHLYRKRKDASAVIRTLELDSFMDFAVTLATLISFSLTNYINFAIDSVLGLIISIAIAGAGVRLILSSAGKLLGEAQPMLEEKIRTCVQDAGVQTVSLRIHNYGQGVDFAELTLAKSPHMNTAEAECIRMNIKRRLAEEILIRATVEWEENYGEREKKDRQRSKGR